MKSFCSVYWVLWVFAGNTGACKSACKSTLIWSLKNSKLSCSRINYMIFFNELQLQPWLKSIKTIVYSGVGWQKISVCHAHCLHTPFNQQRNATEQHASLWVRLSQGVSFKLSNDKPPTLSLYVSTQGAQLDLWEIGLDLSGPLACA